MLGVRFRALGGLYSLRAYLLHCYMKVKRECCSDLPSISLIELLVGQSHTKTLNARKVSSVSQSRCFIKGHMGMTKFS